MMKAQNVLGGLVVLAGVTLAAPAMAAPFCTPTTPGFQISFGVHVGGELTKEQEMRFHKMALTKRGVGPTRVETWNGFLRVWVRTSGNAEEMQFYNPGSYERVY